MTVLDKPPVATMLPEAKLYIDGVVRRAEGERTYDNIGPWTGAVIGVSADASAADVEEAIAAARRAFDTTDWSTNHARRLELIEAFYALCVANRDRFSDIVRYEAGASLVAVNRAQLSLAFESWKDLIGLFPSIAWEKDRGTDSRMGFPSRRKSVHEAIGLGLDPAGRAARPLDDRISLARWRHGLPARRPDLRQRARVERRA